MRTRIAALVTGLLAFGGPAAAEVLNMRAFQERVAAEIHRQQPLAKITSVGEDKLEVELPSDGGGTLRLDRIYALYQGNPSALDQLLEVYVASLAPLTPATAEALVVLVRSFDPAESRARGLVRPLAGHLSVFIAVDRPDTYEIASADLPSVLKLDNAAIWERAFANTRAQLTFNPPALLRGKPTEISADSPLVSSLLAFDDFWDSPQLAGAGPVVVAPFARHMLLVARLDDTAAVSRLRKMMDDVRGDPNVLGSELIVRRDRRWEVLR